MNCPACGSGKLSSWTVWVAVPYWQIYCPDCGAECRPEKTGVARFSTFLLALPAGTVLTLGVVGIYWNTVVFLLICLSSLALDYFIDMKLVRLSVKARGTQNADSRQ